MTQYEKFVPKGWGGEFWIVNKKEYCGKILHFFDGKKCSWHYHLLKDETFHLLSGKMIVRLSDGDDIEKAQIIQFNPGDTIHIYPGLRHQMEAIGESEILEISTEHFDEDSYRVIKGD